MDKKFNFTAQVKTSAKEAWEDRPKEWSYNCVVENEIDEVSEDLLLLIHAFILGLLSNKN